MNECDQETELVIWSEKERYVTQNDEKSKFHDDSVQSHNYLRKDGARLSVCREMSLSTLGLGEWSVHDWVMSSVRQR